MNEVINSEIKFANIKNENIAHRIIGDGKPLVLFNRFRGTINDWDPAFIARLAKKNKVIVFDNLGVGNSSGTSPNSIEGMAEIASDLITHLGFDKVNVLGWSMGGLVVQAFVLNYPEIVEKAVLVGTGLGASENTEYPTERFLDVATKVYDMKPEHHQTVFFTDDQKGLNAANESLSRISKYVSKVIPTQPETWIAQGTATKNYFFSEKNYYEKIKSIAHPVLIAGAKEDIAFSGKNSFLLYQQIPNSQLILYSNAAHGFHHQLPDDFGGLVERFLAKL
ncbi:alpha/beta fold hydrolase [Crocinitomix catalasitica]|uniref:alpha/beta fold hydrolase n=1 Tax=Crocinitomix catalasitica TaxID=184607 RepID=UPI00048580F2|nr:alpha/beta hydrolase [Crocinitomix catalasitica]